MCSSLYSDRAQYEVSLVPVMLVKTPRTCSAALCASGTANWLWSCCSRLPPPPPLGAPNSASSSCSAASAPPQCAASGGGSKKQTGKGVRISKLLNNGDKVSSEFLQTCTLQIASIQLRPWAALLAWKVNAATAL